MSEIERKFLVTAVPDVRSIHGDEIVQGYFPISDPMLSIRVRRSSGKFFITIKHGSGIERMELNIPIVAEQFTELWPLTEERQLHKTRYCIPVGDVTAHVDCYHDDLEGCCTVEVEFSSLQEAHIFLPPRWFGRELTDDPRYTNEALAAHGWP